MSEPETKIVVYTVVVRVPKGESTGWSVYGVDTKGGYHGDVIDYSVVDVEERTP